MPSRNLTAPTSRLAAVIDLATAVVNCPTTIAELAEQGCAGNGASVFDYLKDLEQGFAMPIMAVREYDGFPADQLVAMLGAFHPPQRYSWVNRKPALAAVCDTLMASPVVRELTVQHPSSTPGQ